MVFHRSCTFYDRRTVALVRVQICLRSKSTLTKSEGKTDSREYKGVGGLGRNLYAQSDPVLLHSTDSCHKWLQYCDHCGVS